MTEVTIYRCDLCGTPHDDPDRVKGLSWFGENGDQLMFAAPRETETHYCNACITAFKTLFRREYESSKKDLCETFTVRGTHQDANSIGNFDV